MTTGPTIDAESLAVLAQAPIDFGAVLGSLCDENIAAVREQLASLPAPPPTEGVEWVDHDVDADTGVKVRVYRPAGVDGALPCIYWIHGGGLVLGSYDGEGPRLEAWCLEHRCAAVSVEYRLAPEHPFPAAIDDCLAGLRWVFDRAGEVGVDATRIGIGGASAGAGLAAALALRVRDETDLALRFQLLVYPMLDDRQVTRSSQWDEKVWPPSANTYAWTAYLGDAKGDPDVSPYAAPARATDLSGLPPAYVMVGSADGFVDEDVDYAERLRRAGVEVDLHVYAGGFHGFDGAAAGAPLANRANADVSAWLAARL